MPKKIKAQVSLTAGKRIPVPPPADSPVAPLKFSFKLLDLSGNPKFVCALCGAGYLETLLGRLAALSYMTAQEFRSTNHKALRIHRINFLETTEPAGFTSLNEQLRAEEAWQFQLTANAHGRVHGILLMDTFYVVWIDPAHRLYA